MWGGGLVGWGVRVDVNAMLGVGGDVGYGGCEPRIEGIVQCTKRYCTILRQELSHDSIARLNCALPITKTISVIR